jgi:D-serine deaminase-like pyridoxal phosphate-dependent protein
LRGAPPGGSDTPYASVDLDVVERNVRRLQDYCDAHALACRPHIKTHKLPAIAHAQVRAGAVGITCQKLGEAAAMIAAGIEDVLIAYPLLGAQKLERCCGLARAARISVAADSAEVARGLAQAMSERGLEIDFLVDCDTGLGRTGVGSAAEALELARLVDGLPGLRFAGLFAYPTAPGQVGLLEQARAAIVAAGIAVDTVSGGGTRDAFRTHESPVVTELRVGTYVYGDRACLAQGVSALEDCALRVHATVVSSRRPGHAILDVGSKTLTTDEVEAPGVEGYGLILERPGARIVELFEEHARVELAPGEPPLALTDIVTIVPNHACGTTGVQNEVLAHRGGEPIGWWPVTSRGAVR